MPPGSLMKPTIGNLSRATHLIFSQPSLALPGKPDLVFAGRRAVIFVHGCFWHGHDCKRGARMPKANAQYWSTKISRNKARDVEHIHAIRRAGWRVLTVWECEIRLPSLMKRLTRFLG
jgi:DNA mismatch endonuclease (patch repair protein)